MNPTGRLRWVVLDCPIRNWEDPLVQTLFQRIIQLKLEGYRSVYPETVLPIDTSDYIANHQLVCEVDPSGGLHPLLASRTVSRSRCAEYGIPFSGASLATNSSDGTHVEAVKRILEECDRAGQDITYDSSWTIHPGFRDDKALTSVLKEMYTGIFYHVHQAMRIGRCLMGGVIRFKTDRFFHENWGANPLSLDGKVLPNIFVKPLVNEEVTMMYLDRFRIRAAEMAAKYQEHWENVQWIGPRPQGVPARNVVPLRARKSKTAKKAA